MIYKELDNLEATSNVAISEAAQSVLLKIKRKQSNKLRCKLDPVMLQAAGDKTNIVNPKEIDPQDQHERLFDYGNNNTSNVSGNSNVLRILTKYVTQKHNDELSIKDLYYLKK